eukprot:TRINITY_DN58247_c0_g1_i1.p1 TRINITY_DN58247_c0_g1~~TRINITY_DN58247_c0_g1_i1.p1  ORF type:complete len:503 (-),score=47.54 TRINITY_DN58247_c0_g1_i1:51-1559(-)
MMMDELFRQCLNEDFLKSRPKNLDVYAAVYLCFAAETIDKLTGTNHLPHHLARIHPSLVTRFQQRKRCSFSPFSDKTTLSIIARAIEDADDEADLLYRVTVAVVVANSRERFEFLEEPLRLCNPMSAAKFEELMLPAFGRCAPPRALLQGVRTTLDRYGRRGHFENCGAFIEDIGCSGKCQRASQEISKIRMSVKDGKMTTAHAFARVQAVLRFSMGISRFAALVIARHLGAAWPEICDMGSTDIGKGAIPGLAFVFGGEVARWKDVKLQQDSVAMKGVINAFLALREALPWELARQDDRGLVQKLTDLGLMPLHNQTNEHILCEVRKLLGSGCAEFRIRCTPVRDYRQLWAAAEWRIQRLAALQGRPRSLPEVPLYTEAEVCEMNLHRVRFVQTLKPVCRSLAAAVSTMFRNSRERLPLHCPGMRIRIARYQARVRCDTQRKPATKRASRCQGCEPQDKRFCDEYYYERLWEQHLCPLVDRIRASWPHAVVSKSQPADSMC